MEFGCGFDFIRQQRSDQNALDAPLPDSGFNLLFANCDALLCTDELVNYDWPEMPTEFRDNSPLDFNPCIFPQDAENEAEIQARGRTWESTKPMAIRWPEDATIGTSSSRRPICTFHRCTSSPFRTMCDLKMHLKGHSYEILNQWTGGQKQHCKWPNCSSKATFKSKRTLQTHLENIHVDPLLCPEKGCSYRFPFRSNYDLKRHVRTVHYGEKGLQFHCPFLECNDFPKTFVRKDKWLNHLRSEHDDAICPLNHCGGPNTGTLVGHIKNFHGNFECQIGSCGSQPASRFAKFELMKHLEVHHGIQNGDINVAQNAAVQASDRSVKSEDLPMIATWDDCILCLGKDDTLERSRDEVICLD